MGNSRNKINPITEITISKVYEFNNIFDATEERIIELEHSQKKTSRPNYREQKNQGEKNRKNKTKHKDKLGQHFKKSKFLQLKSLRTGRPGVLRFMGSQRVGHD